MRHVSLLLLALASVAWAEASPSGCTQTDPSKVVMTVCRDSSELVFIDTDTESICGKVSVGEWAGPHMAMFRPKGDRILVSGTQRNIAVIIEFPSLKVLATLDVGNSPEHFDITSDSRYAFMGLMDDNQVSVIDMDGCREVKRLGGVFGPHGITCFPCACLAWKGERMCCEQGLKPRVYVSSLHAHEVAVFDPEDLDKVVRIHVGNAEKTSRLNPDQGLGDINGVVNPTLTPSGKYIYAADGDSGTLAIIETKGNTVEKTLVVGAGAWRAYSSPDGKCVVIPCNGDSTVRVISTESNAEVASFPAGGNMTGANFVEGGAKCYVVTTLADGQGGALWVYDLERMKPAGRIMFGANTTIETACTHPDWHRIYLACSSRNSVFVVDGRGDKVKEIANVGQFPWGTHSYRGGDNYCH